MEPGEQTLPFSSLEEYGQRAPAPTVANTHCFHTRSVQGENSPRSSAFICRQHCINLGPLREGSDGSSAGRAASSVPAPATGAAQWLAAAPKPGGGSVPPCCPADRTALRGAFLLLSFI